VKIKNNNENNYDKRVANLFDNYDHLGNVYPYYIKDKNKKFNISFKEVIKKLPEEKRKIDPTAIMEFISKTYLLNNRTLIKDIKCTPWMAKPLNNSWNYANIPDHNETIMSVKDIVEKLKRSLKQEALSYIADKKTIGILLSGGLDSRITAGIIKELQISGDFSGNVVSLNWGLKNSRDVCYAKEISRRYNWEYLHFDNDLEQLKQNIKIAGKDLGAQISGIHLHAMPKIRGMKNIDAIVAGSYGDSVGRAEFSGKHVTNLESIIPNKFYLFNRFGLIKDKIIKDYVIKVQHDAYAYRNHINRAKDYQYKEIEQEMHYMRRKLQLCMSYINEEIPVYQLFTDPNVFSIMWNLNPNIRNNDIYINLLKKLPKKIGEIPWARTGKVLGQNKIKDNKLSSNHKYGYWLRNDLGKYISDLVLSNNILSLNIFNEKSLKNLINLWQKNKKYDSNIVDEIISWMASLSIFIEEYGIKSDVFVEKNYKDTLNSLWGKNYAWLYHTKPDFYKKIINFLGKHIKFFK